MFTQHPPPTQHPLTTYFLTQPGCTVVWCNCIHTDTVTEWTEYKYRAVHKCVQLCTQKCSPSVQVAYSSTVYLQMNLYIYKVQCPCVCVCPVSCVHRSTVHQYKLCTVVQYICTQIYVCIKCYVCVFVSCLFGLSL